MFSLSWLGLVAPTMVLAQGQRPWTKVIACVAGDRPDRLASSASALLAAGTFGLS